MNVVIRTSGLTKRYGKTIAIDNIGFEIPPGRIVGLIGANGSGKTTTLKAILGSIPVEGELEVLGFDPRTQRNELMHHVSFIADAAILPQWIKVQDLVAFMAGVHPKFDRTKAEKYIANTTIQPHLKVKELSKGMVVQLHLALIMAVDARLLVLDEPTLGLDIIHRQQFYRALLDDYFDADRTIVITTHQIEEIEHVVSDLIFIADGKVVLQETMDSLTQRFVEVEVRPEMMGMAEDLQPIDQHTKLGSTRFLFDGVPAQRLAELGSVHVPKLADIFLATMKRVAS